MRFLWLGWLPLLFLPNLGMSLQTRFGVLEISDFLIVPFLVTVVLAVRRGGRRQVDCLWPMLCGFVGWALVSTLLVRERYGYMDHFQVVFGALKLGKLSLYATAGVLAARALGGEVPLRRFLWSILVAGLVVAVGLMQFGEDHVRKGRPGAIAQAGLIEGYKAANGVSVLMAMLLCFIGGLWMTGRGSRRWRVAAVPAFAAMVVGFLLSHGRGGWVAGLAGVLYFFSRRGVDEKAILGLIAAAVVVATAYATLPDFSRDLDRTLWPSQDYLLHDGAGIGGIDEGGRLISWGHEIQVFARSPLLGTGFFHRAGASGLWRDGSHNFFLQMFLETGLVGGMLIAGAFVRMWYQAGSLAARADGLEVPLKSALVAAIVGGISGEYFYGSSVVLGLFLVYAPVGALPLANPEDRRRCPRSSR